MKSVLITGGAGFIGSNLAAGLVGRGCRVTVFDNLSEQIHGSDPVKTSPVFNSLPPEVQFIRGSVTSSPELEAAIFSSGCDTIIHFAAETGTGQSMYEIEKYSDVNIGGTARMMDILTNKAGHGVKKIVVASSRSIYGEGRYLSKKFGVVYPGHRAPQDMDRGVFGVSWQGDFVLELLPTDEDSLIHPSSVYGITKQVQEQLVMTVSPAIGIAPVALRYQNVYGPGQSLSNPYTGILSIFSTRILSGKPITIFEDGKESRDFVFIDDVVDATIRAAADDAANGRVYNVGTGVATPVSVVVEALMKAYGREVPCSVTGNYRLGDIRHNFADIQRIQRELGFVPRTSFETGIERFASWVVSQPAARDLYEASLTEMKKKGLFR